MNLDKDTVKRMENILHNLIDHVVSITRSDEDIDENIDSLISDNVAALLKEAHAGNEAVAKDVIVQAHQAGQMVAHVDPSYRNAVAYYDSLIKTKPTSPPTQEVEALKARLEKVGNALELARTGLQWYVENSNDASGCDDEALEEIDEALATIDNTNESLQANTGSE